MKQTQGWRDDEGIWREHHSLDEAGQPKEEFQQIGDGYTIRVSDKPDDLLLMGTELLGSCQHVNGSPSKNKALVGYLIGGETLPIVVHGPDGKIAARSVLRMLWDEKSGKPVILQERIYPLWGCRAGWSDAIDKKAVAVAEDLGLTLVGNSDVGWGPRFTGTAEFLGGRAPFLYSDAGPGLCSGEFTVPGCRELYSPESAHA